MRVGRRRRQRGDGACGQPYIFAEQAAGRLVRPHMALAHDRGQRLDQISPVRRSLHLSILLHRFPFSVAVALHLPILGPKRSICINIMTYRFQVARPLGGIITFPVSWW